MGMPNQRQTDKVMLRFWIPLELYEMFRKRSSELGCSMSELLTLYVVQQTKNVTLTPEEYEKIAQKIREKGGC